MELSYGVKVHPEDVNVKAISVIRKHRKLAMGAICRRATESECLYACDETDSAGLANLIVLYRDLVAVGVTPLVFDDDKPVGIEEVETDLRSQRKDVTREDNIALVEDELWWNLDLG